MYIEYIRDSLSKMKYRPSTPILSSLGDRWLHVYIVNQKVLWKGIRVRIRLCWIRSLPEMYFWLGLGLGLGLGLSQPIRML